MQLLPAIFLTILAATTVQAQDCICTYELAPVCSGGVTYGNACMAKCAGADVNKIMSGECPPGTQNLTKTWSG